MSRCGESPVAVVLAVAMLGCQGQPVPDVAGDGIASCVDGEFTYVDGQVGTSRRYGAAMDTGSFGTIQDVAQSGDTAWVLDAIQNRVYVLSPATGAVVDSLGRPGAGPGEFGGAWKLGLTAEGNVVVLDAALWRVTYFFGADSVVTMRLIPDVEMGQFPDAWIDASGDVFRLGFGPFYDALVASGESDDVVRGRNVIERWNKASEEWERLLEVPGRGVLFTGRRLRDPPFAPGPVWVPDSEGGFWYGDGATPRLTRFTSAGDPICHIELAIGPVPVSDAERSAYYSPSRSDLTDGQRIQLRRSREDMPVPEDKPSLRLATIDRDGTLWIMSSLPEGRLGNLWHRVDVTGGSVARFVFPREFSLLHAGRTTVWGVVRDSLQVPYLASYEVDAMSN